MTRDCHLFTDSIHMLYLSNFERASFLLTMYFIKDSIQTVSTRVLVSDTAILNNFGFERV
jgi:hypothetical protein